MAELKPWVERSTSPRVRTGGWRTAGVPRADLERCTNCLLCWLYCPDSAVRLDGTTFVRFDEDVCKGCAVCVEVCPTDAIRMEDE